MTWIGGLVALAVTLASADLPRVESSQLPGGGAPSCLAITNVTVIDGTGAPARPGQRVLVRGDRIISVGSDAGGPAGKCLVVDGRGRYLLPGFWDVHVHLSKIGPSALPLFVANGITSVRDMGGDLAEVLGWRSEISAGQRIGPRIFTPGPIVESAANVQRMKDEGVVEPVARTRIALTSPAEADALVADLVKRGADFIKVRTWASREAYFALADAARRAGVPLVGHAMGLSPEDLIRSGQRSIEHVLFPLLDDRGEDGRLTTFKSMAAAGIVMVPTGTVQTSLLASSAYLKSIVADERGELDWRRRYISEHLLADWREQLAERQDPDQGLKELVARTARNIREMKRAGMTILPGTDSAVLLVYPGFSFHDELQQLHETGGLTPMEVILSATRDAARFLGQGGDSGTIEAGKRADLVLLDDNPLASLANTRRIGGVVAAGRYLDRAALRDTLALGRAPGAAHTVPPVIRRR